MSDIRDAISAGREVTAHERNISVKDWTGLGYSQGIQKRLH